MSLRADLRQGQHGSGSDKGPRFLYLVQTRSALPQDYHALSSDRSDVIALSWGESVEGQIYLPKSTWTEGRNRLLAAAKEKGRKYLHYIFVDDDIRFLKGDWRVFEDALVKYEPAIATPYCPWYPAMKHSNLKKEAHRAFAFDAICNAFRRDVIAKDLLIPYESRFDSSSWWASQWVVIQRARNFFPEGALQINTVWIDNLAHGAYPKSADMKEVRRWYYRTILKKAPHLAWTGRVQAALEKVMWFLWFRHQPPRRMPWQENHRL